MVDPEERMEEPVAPTGGDGSEESPPPAPSMADLARGDQLQLLEEVWLDEVESLGPVGPFLEAIEPLLEKGTDEVAATLVTLLAEALLEARRYGDAFQVLRPVSLKRRLGKAGAALRLLLVASLKGMYEGEDWFPLFLLRSGLEGEGPMGKGLETFESLLPFRPGSPLIYFRESRPGLIESMDPEDGMCLIRFVDGSERRLSLDVTRELHLPLEPGDWRARQVTEPEALRQEALDSPGTVVRNVIQSRDGKATAPEIKADLLGPVIPQAKWNSWWKRAREEAKQDPYIGVEGSRSRPVFVLRGRPVSLDEEAMREVQWARGLGEAVARTRRYSQEKISPEVARKLAGEVGRRLEAEADTLRSKEPGAILEGALLMEALGEPPPDVAEVVLRDALEGPPEDASEALALLLRTVPSREGRTAILEKIRSLAPEEWAHRLSAAIEGLPEAPVEEALDFLLKAGELERVVTVFRVLLATPFRHRDAVIHLTRAWAKGTLGEEIAPVDLLDALLPLARDLARPPRGEKVPPRIARGLIILLVGTRKPLIVRLLDAATEEDFQRWAAFAASAPDLPWEITEAIRARAPVPDFEGPAAYWGGEAIFCTREGIARRRENLRVLVEDKIPANRNAIGEAAAHGDLSENAEWQAAIEEQYSLAEQSRVMEEEMAKALPIEDQPRPDGVASPGSKVSYRDEGTGEKATITILGPWDIGDGVVSYRAPLARGILGRKVGETLDIVLPGGTHRITIQEIERFV